MTKDGLRDRIAADLKRAFDHVLSEPVPQAFSELLRRLR